MVVFKSILKEELSDFYALREATLSENTLAHDRATLLTFDRYLHDNNVADKVLSEEIVSGWIQSLNVGKNTIVNKAVFLRIFTRYLNSVGIDAFTPEIPKCANDYVPYIFTEDEMKRIFASADNIAMTGIQPNPYIQLELPMVIRILYGCGLRIGETLSLRIGDVDFVGGILTVKHTKGDKQRLVPMHASLTSVLQSYCLAMGLMGKSGSLLFPSAENDVPMTTQAARDKFKFTILRESGISTKNKAKRKRGPCLHCLRHVFAFKSFAQAERAGRPVDDSVPYLSTYLGHETLNETARYLRFSSDLFPEALERFEDYTMDVFPEVLDDEE
jgi:integrase